MKKIIFLYAFLVLIVIGLAVIKFTGISGLIPKGSSKSDAQAVIKNATFKLEVVRTDQDKQKGLSGRDKLDKDTGMLFVFDQKGKYSFWMKDMKFPIDILFIEKTSTEGLTSGTVVDIIENAAVPEENAPPSSLEVYAPEKDADLVLEINQGIAKEKEIQVGDTVSITGVE